MSYFLYFLCSVFVVVFIVALHVPASKSSKKRSRKKRSQRSGVFDGHEVFDTDSDLDLTPTTLFGDDLMDSDFETGGSYLDIY